MVISQSDLEFYCQKTPCLANEYWNWSDWQTFLEPRAWIKFSDNLKTTRVYWHNNGQRTWFSLKIETKKYPSSSFYIDDLKAPNDISFPDLVNIAAKEAERLYYLNLTKGK